MFTEEELKPCLFCGGEAVLHGQHAPEHWVQCLSCRASTDTTMSSAQSIKAWNTRTKDKRIEELEEELEIALSKLRQCANSLNGFDRAHFLSEAGFIEKRALNKDKKEEND